MITATIGHEHRPIRPARQPHRGLRHTHRAIPRPLAPLPKAQCSAPTPPPLLPIRLVLRSKGAVLDHPLSSHPVELAA
jgi:hypothetical protein